MRCYFAVLSIDMFVFFTRYFLRYLSLKLDISFIKLLLLFKVYDIRFRSEIICSSQQGGYGPLFLERSHLTVRN